MWWVALLSMGVLVAESDQVRWVSYQWMYLSDQHLLLPP